MSIYIVIGQIWSSINYGLSFTQQAGPFGNSGNQYIQLGGLAMSSDGTKVIAAVNGLGKYGL